MEALSAFGVNRELLLIQVANFGLLLFILYRFLYKPLFAILEKRQIEIQKGIDDAKSATEEKERIANEKDAIMQSAREEGGKIVEGLRKEGLEAERKMLRESQEKSTILLGEARAKAEEERAYLLRESEKEIARIATLAAEKILRASGKEA